jgi:abortive infection bacteriophage resistance protein
MPDYTKPPLSVEQQIELLEKRGLQIPERKAAERLLSTVSYYRLRGYTYPFQENVSGEHPFHKGTGLDFIEYVYEFDRRLRLIVMDALERIEIAFRAQIVLQFSIDFGPWWFEEPSLFRHTGNHSKDLKELDIQVCRSSEPFIGHHKKKYGASVRPPAWKCFETASFGLVSKFFQNLKSSLSGKKKLCSFFGLKSGGFRILENWMQHLTIVRNICAHHGRLWDRLIVLELSYAPALEGAWIRRFPDGRKRYATLSLLAWLTHRITDSAYLSSEITDLLQEYEAIPLERLGFPAYWKDEPLWRPQ